MSLEVEKKTAKCLASFWNQCCSEAFDEPLYYIEPATSAPFTETLSYRDGPVRKAGAAAGRAPYSLQHPPVQNGMGKDGTGPSPTVTPQICVSELVMDM